jgi:hypothetical protein
MLADCISTNLVCADLCAATERPPVPTDDRRRTADQGHGDHMHARLPDLRGDV